MHTFLQNALCVLQESAFSTVTPRSAICWEKNLQCVMFAQTKSVLVARVRDSHGSPGYECVGHTTCTGFFCQDSEGDSRSHLDGQDSVTEDLQSSWFLLVNVFGRTACGRCDLGIPETRRSCVEVFLLPRDVRDSSCVGRPWLKSKPTDCRLSLDGPGTERA